MHLPKEKIPGNPSAKDKIGRAVHSIGEALQLSDLEFARIIQRREGELSGLRAHDFADLSMLELDRLCDKAHVNLDQLLKGNVDLDALREQHEGKLLVFPKKYDQGLFSRAHTAQNFIAFLESSFGADFKMALLRYIQLENIESIDPKSHVSVNLPEDIFHFVMERFARNHWRKTFLDMGTFNARCYQQSRLLVGLEKIKSPGKVIEKFISQKLNYIDQTWSYSIVKITAKELTFDVVSRERTMDTFRTNRFGCFGSCYTKAGFALELLRLSKPARKFGIKKTKCAILGQDPVCRYELHY